MRIIAYYYTVRKSAYLYSLRPVLSMIGWDVGDIIDISELAEEVAIAYKDAPNNISEKVTSLQSIIDKVVQYFENTTLSDNDRQLGQEVLKSCQSVLEDLDSLIGKYNGLSSSNIHQVFNEVKLGTEDSATLRAKLILNTILLNSFVQRSEISIYYYYRVYHADISTSAVSCLKCKTG